MLKKLDAKKIRCPEPEPEIWVPAPQTWLERVVPVVVRSYFLVYLFCCLLSKLKSEQIWVLLFAETLRSFVRNSLNIRNFFVFGYFLWLRKASRPNGFSFFFRSFNKNSVDHRKTNRNKVCSQNGVTCLTIVLEKSSRYLQNIWSWVYFVGHRPNLFFNDWIK